ncbi:beta-barrel assembly-enhancing protease [Abditibacteriota bacterium]|nr:beta-barrel assembly-enhancing protease [Abditibacteriota bacterium]
MLPFRGLSSGSRLALMGGGLLALVGAEGALLFFLSSRSPAPVVAPTPLPGTTPVPAPTEQMYIAPGVATPPPIVPSNPSIRPNPGNPAAGRPPAPGVPSSLLPPAPNPNGPKPSAPNPQMARAAQLFDQASAALKSGDKKGAVALWEEVVKIAPNDLSTRQNLALVYSELNRPKDAIPHAQAAVKIVPNDPKAQFQLARLLLATKQIKAALDPLRATVRLAPQEREGHALLARVLADTRQPKEALAQWTFLAQRDGHDLEAHLMAAAVANDVLRNPAEAKKWLRRAQSQNPTAPQVPLTLSQLLMGSRDFKGAAAVLQQGVKSTPDAFALYPALAEALTADKDRPGAINALQGALARVPKGAKGASELEGRLRLTLGKLYGDGKQPKEARNQFTRAAQLLPSDPEPLAMAALSEIDLKNFPNATKLLGQALALAPKNLRIRLLAAQTFAQNKQWKEADAQFETYCAAQPRDKNALFQWARVAHELKNPSREANALGRLVALVPRDPRLWMQLGAAQLAAGSKGEALTSLQNAFALEPRDVTIPLQIAGMQTDAGNARGAMETLQKALNARPDYAPLYLLFLQAGDAANQKDEARDYIVQKLANQPQNGGALSGALKFYDDKKRRDDARAMLNAVVARNPNATLAKKALEAYDTPTATTAPEPTKAP